MCMYATFLALTFEHLDLELGYFMLCTIKPVLSGHSKIKPKIGFLYQLSLNAGQSIAILSTSIKLPLSIKNLILSIFKCLLKTGFTVYPKIWYITVQLWKKTWGLTYFNVSKWIKDYIGKIFSKDLHCACHFWEQFICLSRTCNGCACTYNGYTCTYNGYTCTYNGYTGTYNGYTCTCNGNNVVM